MNTLFARDFESLSRREFLRHAQTGLLALFVLPFLDRGVGRGKLIPAAANSEVPEQGRVLDNTLSVYSRPSFSSKLVNMYWRDLVLPIDGVTIGDRYPEHNRVWYQVNNNEGYAHSGKVQPVAIQNNPPLDKVPEKGQLAEVTVPFTDARWDPNRADRFAYRLYYSTVYWITDVLTDQQDKKWYQIPDDKYKLKYYVNAEHLRAVPPEDLAPISPQVPVEEKRLEVRLNEQLVVAYEEDRPVFMTRMASGGRFIDGDYTTPTGRYITNRKRPSRHMASGDLAAPSAYDLPGVPWVCYLTKSGISFHGTYWHNDFGKPRSHGCLNLSAQAARWIYRWTNPPVPLNEHTWNADEGTRVDVIE
jgi:lipoprotein-anchoring transpeptidase ErfK/SrfK